MLFKVVQPDHEWGESEDGSIHNSFFYDILVIKAEDKEECMAKLKSIFDRSIKEAVKRTNEFRLAIGQPTITKETEPQWFEWPTFEVNVLEGDVFTIDSGDYAQSRGDISPLEEDLR